MKKRFLALLLGALFALSSCTPSNSSPADTSETDTMGDSVADEITTADSAPEKPPVEYVKTLTDTDTPDKSKKLKLTYDSYDRLGLQYATGTLGSLYDGNINTRLAFYTPDTATSFNTAKLESPKVIEAIKLFCAIHYERNIGLELQASVDGKTYATLYTLTAADADSMENGPLVVEISDATAYLYFRVYHKNSDSGYDLNEVELYGSEFLNSYFGEFVRVTPAFEKADDLGIKYIYGTMPGDAEGFRFLWDHNDDTRICYFPWEGGTSFNTAKFASPTVIAKLRLISVANISRNEGVEIRASVDGETWTVLHTISADDVTALTSDQSVEILMPEDDTAYLYIQVYHRNSNNGYDLNGLDVYSGSRFTDPDNTSGGTGDTGDTTVRNYQKVAVTYLDFGDGKGGKDTQYIFGDKKGSEEGIKLIWDGVTDTTYCNYYNWDNAGSYTSACFAEATVIGKIVLATIWKPAYNIGTAIQVSVDGETWVTLYIISAADGSFVEGDNEWKLETLEIIVNDPTAYHYIRVYDTAGKGYCLAEVEVYKVS